MLVKASDCWCTDTGTRGSVATVLSPKRPSALAPQHHAWPALVRPQVCASPAVIEVKLTPDCQVATATDELAAELSPSWPMALRPQHHAWPAEVSPHAWSWPPSM